MYVRRVVLENVRCFERLDFKFGPRGDRYPGWTVITGDNAAGKTTLLKAIALALVGPDAARTLVPSMRGWVREGCEEATIAVEIVAGDEDRFRRAGARYKEPFWSELRLSNGNGPEVTLGQGARYRRKGKGPAKGPWADNPEGWFSAGYGPFRRLYGASPNAQRVMSGPGRVARYATMFLEDATLGECELWLTDLSHKRLEHRQKETEILDRVLLLLNDDFLRNGVRVDRVDSEGLWLRDMAGVTLRLADMSEGYRAALAMLVDVLRQMIAVYGHQAFTESVDGHLSVRYPGVVLVDEVDSHLHPEWQRVIGFWLKERFPKVQFIVSTHSPIICQAADQDGIFHLPTPGTDVKPFQIKGEEYQRIIRSKPDAIYVSPAFGLEHTRSPLAVRKREEYAGLRAKQHAGRLSGSEGQEIRQLRLWIDPAEDEKEDEDACAGSSEGR